MALVPEKAVKATIKRLALHDKLVVEGAGALSLAAALAVPARRRGRSICVLTGGNIDADQLSSILSDPELDDYDFQSQKGTDT